VPSDGDKLNARRYFGGRDKLSALQDHYAGAMASMGLERGKKGSKAKHQVIQKHYDQVNMPKFEKVQKHHDLQAEKDERLEKIKNLRSAKSLSRGKTL